MCISGSKRNMRTGQWNKAEWKAVDLKRLIRMYVYTKQFISGTKNKKEKGTMETDLKGSRLHECQVQVCICTFTYIYNVHIECKFYTWREKEKWEEDNGTGKITRQPMWGTRCVCACICRCVYIYVCVFTYVYVCICICVQINLFMHMHIYTYICVFI